MLQPIMWQQLRVTYETRSRVVSLSFGDFYIPRALSPTTLRRESDFEPVNFFLFLRCKCERVTRKYLQIALFLDLNSSKTITTGNLIYYER